MGQAALMRVVIDTSYVARGRSGTAVYIEQLIAALRAAGRVEVHEVSQPRRLERGGANSLRSAANWALDLDWLRRGLPKAAGDARADVVHHPLPAHSARIAAAQVLTVHDVAFAALPERFNPLWRRLAERQHSGAVRRSGAIVCVSETAAEEARTLLGAPADRIVVAPHGPGQFEPEAPPAGDGEHFLFVGDAEPRKNLPGLLSAYAAYRSRVAAPLPLVLAGPAAVAAEGAGVRGILFPAERLHELYRSARALVHSSLHEGFGLTLLEAMALGIPVLAVRNPGVEENSGRAALLVGAAELADGLTRLHGDPELRRRLVEAGQEHARRFSWAESARLHERAYTLAAGGTP